MVLNHPWMKNMGTSQIGSSPQGSGWKYKKLLKPPPRSLIFWLVKKTEKKTVWGFNPHLTSVVSTPENSCHPFFYWQKKHNGQVIQAVTFLSPIWRSLTLWRGHLTIPKRAQRIARGIFFQICSFQDFCWRDEGPFLSIIQRDVDDGITIIFNRFWDNVPQKNLRKKQLSPNSNIGEGLKKTSPANRLVDFLMSPFWKIHPPHLGTRTNWTEEFHVFCLVNLQAPQDQRIIWFRRCFFGDKRD